MKLTKIERDILASAMQWDSYLGSWSGWSAVGHTSRGMVAAADRLVKAGFLEVHTSHSMDTTYSVYYPVEKAWQQIRVCKCGKAFLETGYRLHVKKTHIKAET